MKSSFLVLLLLYIITGKGQSFATTAFRISIESPDSTNQFFKKDPLWRGADGAASVDMGNGKILWLFSDTFICADSSKSRNKSTIIRNSIAIQDGYNINNASVQFYWNKSKKANEAFFKAKGKYWFWTGHGIRIKDKLLVFLIKESAVKTGLGFKAIGWSAVLISNPDDEPSVWEMKYIEGPETFSTIAGSAAVLKDENYLYAFGSVEPSTHEVYLLRWKLTEAYQGILSNLEWWINERWATRKTKLPIPKPLFTGATEYSVHYDSVLHKYIQVQSFGFGEASVGLRTANQLTGPWTEPIMIDTPVYTGIKKPLMYAAKAHPELEGNGIYITYNINSVEFEELLTNQSIYFPRFLLLKFEK
jgi:hypothetical protein